MASHTKKAHTKNKISSSTSNDLERKNLSPKAISISHFTASGHLLLSPPSVNLPSAKRSNGVVSCALNIDSSPRLPVPIDLDETSSTLAIEPVRHEINGGVKRWPKFSFVEDGRFTPLSRRPRLSCALKTAWWRSLWARIFFASKKAAKVVVVSFHETLRFEVKDDVGITIATHGWISNDISKGKFMLEGGAELQWKEEREVNHLSKIV
ncbi:hypothetical protein Cni_G22119 [Canna indica]|uniref:Uncharacterized protein n=1 Tax=Canna indica TaxID=4628 RepID=A0AAQ3QJA7_9LILI|nr:hypothetical protein Cni_G22119 [Canna indica]